LGTINRKPYFAAEVAKGGTFTKVVEKDRSSLEGETFQADIMETYVPILRDGRFAGAFEVYVDITEHLGNLRKTVTSASAVLFSVAFGLLMLVIIGLTRQARRMDEQQAIEARIRENEERLQTVMRSSLDAIITTDPEGAITAFNDAAQTLFGYSENEVLGKKLADMIIPPEHAHDNPDDLAKFIETLSGPILSRRMEMSSYRTDGSPAYLDIAVSKSDGEAPAITTTFIRDITEVKLAREKVEFMASHDNLTGLANRHLLGDLFDGARARSKRSKSLCAVMTLDLDNFKPINDNLGHAAGDSVLQLTAERILASIRKSDAAARIGGDEFVVLLEQLSDVDSARAVAQKLIDAVAQPCPIDRQEAQVGVSIGISIFPTDGDSLPDLLEKSDVAMYEVKKGGKNSYAVC